MYLMEVEIRQLSMFPPPQYRSYTIARDIYVILMTVIELCCPNVSKTSTEEQGRLTRRIQGPSCFCLAVALAKPENTVFTRDGQAEHYWSIADT